MFERSETGSEPLKRGIVLSLVSFGYILILAGLLFSILTQSWNLFSALVFIGAILTTLFILLT